MTLFEPDLEPPPEADPSAPLAARMRPRTLDEVVGQEHLLAPGSPLRRLVEGDAPLSLILFGPPGTGKTTLALIVSTATNRRFEQLSALNAGVKDVRDVIARAKSELTRSGCQTVLFIDEIHRFSKTQQDSLLGAVEARHVTLVAATTENPFFSIVSPLLSRSLLLTLQPLTDEDVGTLVDRALADERGLAGVVGLDDDARAHLLRMSGGDARRALTAIEAAAGTTIANGAASIDLPTLEQAVDTAAVRYDRDGDQHYDVISAFIKSIRGSDADAALHYLARMIEAGEDARFIARRLVVHASEDVGLADPTALLAATAAAEAVQLIGMPEARINLAQATIHLALAPKSNAVVRAIDAALGDVRAGLAGSVPPALRDGHYPGAAKLGNAQRYRYPHAVPEGVLAQQYPPDELVGRDYYEPAERGAERHLAERLPKLRAAIRANRDPLGSNERRLSAARRAMTRPRADNSSRRGEWYVSGGAIAGLIAAGAFVLLVLLLAIPLLKLGRVLDETTLAIRKTHDGMAPLLDDAQGTITQVNAQLVHVEGIAKNVNSMTTNVAALTSVVSSTLGSPLIKVAAFSYGVRKTVQDRRDAEAIRSSRRKTRVRRKGTG